MSIYTTSCFDLKEHFVYNKEMSQLILLRHGQSMWNNANLFTGWVDVPLTEKGIEEAIGAGKKIKDIPIDRAFTSTLIRAQETLALALAFHKSGKIPVFQHPEDPKIHAWETIYGKAAKENIMPVHLAWQLNERMYGELQGLNKAETKEKFGEEQVQIWRRSYAVAPPSGESLKECAERTLPYFNERIVPHLANGENVLIAAHGNSLRSILMHLNKLSEEEVVAVEVTLGEPMLYTYQSGQFKAS